jgi:hypothetical protein
MRTGPWKSAYGRRSRPAIVVPDRSSTLLKVVETPAIEPSIFEWRRRRGPATVPGSRREPRTSTLFSLTGSPCASRWTIVRGSTALKRAHCAGDGWTATTAAPTVRSTARPRYLMRPHRPSQPERFPTWEWGAIRSDSPSPGGSSATINRPSPQHWEPRVEASFPPAPKGDRRYAASQPKSSGLPRPLRLRLIGANLVLAIIVPWPTQRPGVAPGLRVTAPVPRCGAGWTCARAPRPRPRPCPRTRVRR